MITEAEIEIVEKKGNYVEDQLIRWLAEKKIEIWKIKD